MVSARSRGSVEFERADKEKAITGGAALTEISDEIVSATGQSPGSAVTTATPAGWWRKAVRKASDILDCWFIGLVSHWT